MTNTFVKGSLIATGMVATLFGSLLGLAWLQTHPVSETYFAVTSDPHARHANRIQLNKYHYVLKQNSRDADAWGWVGLCHSRLGENEQALKAYEMASSLRTNPQFDLTALSVLYGRVGHYDKALRASQQLVHLTPTSLEALRRLANAYTALGREQEAQDVYRNALTQQPKSAKIYFGFSQFQWNQGRYSMGMRSFGTGVLMLISGHK